MLLRILSCIVATVFSASVALAQQLPLDNAVNSSGVATKEWKVSYDRNEDWPRLNFKKRPVVGIRLQITYDADSGDHFGKLWLFAISPITNNPELSGKTDSFRLEIEGSSGGRKRIGFGAKNIDLRTDAGPKKINVSGIWQCGRNKTAASAERIQLKVNHTPHMLPAGPCDDDPDSDILEEGDPPPGDNDPPSEP